VYVLSERVDEHAFSIEMYSNEFLKQVSISKNTNDSVLIEGFLGKIKELNFVEGLMLEIKGENGVLRMDLELEELNLLKRQIPARKCVREVN
jgi:hypothetical protein